MKFLLPTIANKVYYCVKWKIDLIIQLKSMDEERPVPWTKIKVLQKYLPNYEWIVQMDAGFLFNFFFILFLFCFYFVFILFLFCFYFVF